MDATSHRANREIGTTMLRSIAYMPHSQCLQQWCDSRDNPAFSRSGTRATPGDDILGPVVADLFGMKVPQTLPREEIEK